MPIDNITQTVSTIPTPPHRGVDVQSIFVTKQEDFQDHLQGTTVTELNTFKDQLNTRIGEINSTATTMNGYADTASAGASTATTKAEEASTSASGALTSRNQASTFATNSLNSATKASQWADNNYNVEVETGKYSAKHWSTVAQNATVNKVDKVTSTDNAIVRFDGTTGAVQNSLVTIDDNGNVGIGTSSPAFSLDVRNALTTGTLSDNTTVRLKSNNRNSGITLDTAGGSYAGIISNYVNGGNVSTVKFDSSGNILSILPNGGIGYGAGSGGTVTQLTSKSTAVTLNKPTGYISMVNSALSAGASVTFIFNNSLISATDTLNLSIYTSSIATQGSFRLTWSLQAGIAYITLTNQATWTISDAVLINFSIIKGASS